MNLFASLKTRRADLLGLSSSMLCLVHCLLFPLLYAAFSAYEAGAHHHHGHDHAHDHAHGGFNIDYLFATAALVAVITAFRQTSHGWVKLGLGLGWVVMVAGIVLAGQGYPDYVIHLGSVVLVSAHVYNLRKGHLHCAVPH
jgi:MerC mercury resistance protein